jgi:mRNA interferase MazF
MTIPALEFGDIISAKFPQRNPQGHEQEGYRPAIVVGLPTTLGVPRFEVVIVVPITTDRGQRWANVSPDLYPRLPAGIGGLRKPSIVLLDQVQILDVTRIYKYRGRLTPEQCEPILNCLHRIIGH